MKPERDPWADAKWQSDRPTRSAGAGTRVLAFFFMIPAGAIGANLLLFLLFGKAWSAGYFVIAGVPGLGLMVAAGVIGALLGALSVLLYWPEKDE